jgi:hypothetical protein
MKLFLKSRFFWTKVLPTVFFSVFIAGILYPLSSLTVARGVVCVLLLSILWTNVYLKKVWISSLAGSILSLISFYFIFAVLSEYHEFPDGVSYEALKLLTVGLTLFGSAMLMGILLCLPFRQNIPE